MAESGQGPKDQAAWSGGSISPESQDKHDPWSCLRSRILFKLPEANLPSAFMESFQFPEISLQ